MCKNSCCFLGHRKINETDKLKSMLIEIIEGLIVNENVDTFLFGSKSQFNTVCHALVTALKEKYPHIKRVYVRAEFPHISNMYKSYLLENYEDTVYPEKILNAGRASYVERNYEMIDNCRYCVVYYDEHAIPSNRKSGTKIALDYAVKKHKAVIITVTDF